MPATKRIVVALALCALYVSAAHANTSATIISNYPPANDSTQSAFLNDQRIKAIAFTMPAAGDDYFLTGVRLRLGNYDPNETVILQIREHTGSNTAPGANVLMTFTGPPGQGVANADYGFTPNGTLTLQAGSSYWVYVGGFAGQSFDWKASSPGIVPTGIATYGANLFTTNAGGSWSNSTIINTFLIEGKLVPSPGLAAFGVGLAAIGLRRRR